MSVAAGAHAATATPGLLKSATVYGTANVLERLIPVLLLPILTYYVSASDAGMIAVFQAVANVAMPLVGMNVAFSVRRRYFDQDQSNLATYLAGCVWIVAGCTVAGLVWTVLAAAPLGNLTGLPLGWLVVAVIFAGAHELLSVPLTLWQVEHQARRYAMVQVGRAAGIAVITVVFVVVLGIGWRGYAAATLLVTGALALVVAGVVLPPRVEWQVPRRQVAHAFWYGASLIPHRLGTLGVRNLDRFVLAYYVGASETGLYWVAFQVGMAITVAGDAFNRAWSPWLYSGLAERNVMTDRRIVRLTYGYFAGITAVGVLIALGGPAVIRLVLAPEFHEAGRLVGWVVAGSVFNALYLGVSGIVFFAERTLFISSVTIATSIIGLVLNLLLVPRYGAIGAAQASAGALLLKFLCTWAVAHWSRPLPWRLAA